MPAAGRPGVHRAHLPPPSLELVTIATVIFNWSVWSLRTSFFSTLGAIQTEQAAAARIASYALMHLHPEGKGPPFQERQIVALATMPPPNTTVFFCDGSSLDNGDGGAGYSVQVPGRQREDFSKFLGTADNNEAEMEALLGCFRRLLELRRLIGLGGTVIGFSDSACCLGYLLKGWRCPTKPSLARETRRLFHEVRKHFKIQLYWVRGHCGLEGNERVDRLAKNGAAGREGGPGPGDTPTLLAPAEVIPGLGADNNLHGTDPPPTPPEAKDAGGDRMPHGGVGGGAAIPSRHSSDSQVTSTSKGGPGGGDSDSAAQDSDTPPLHMHKHTHAALFSLAC